MMGIIARVYDAEQPIMICGQAQSECPGLEELLVGAGIDSISLNPDRVTHVLTKVASRKQSRDGRPLTRKE